MSLLNQILNGFLYLAGFLETTVVTQSFMIDNAKECYATKNMMTTFRNVAKENTNVDSTSLFSFFRTAYFNKEHKMDCLDIPFQKPNANRHTLPLGLGV